MSIHYVPARRPPTPDIMADVLGPMQDDVTQIRTQLRYDYSLIPAEQRESVQAAAVDIVRAGRRAQDDLMRIGQRLLGVKETLEHGQFEDWCATEFQMSVRTARNMMNVARTFTDKTETVSVLSDSVMYLLAAPSTPEAARVEVIEQARAAGKSPTKIEVQETIRKYQPAYATVAQLEEIVRETAARWYREETPAYAVSDMRAAARVRGGGFWMNCIGKTDPPQWREVDLAMAIRFVADEMERPQPETPGAVFNQNGPSRPAPQPAPQRPAAWDGYADWDGVDQAEYDALSPIWQQPAATLPINADKDITRWRVAARLASERQDNIAFTLQETARRLMRAERYAADAAKRQAEPAKPQAEPAPVAEVIDFELFAAAERAYIGALKPGQMRRPFQWGDGYWVSVGGVYSPGTAPGEFDEQHCVRVHPHGEPIAPGARIGRYRADAYLPGTELRLGSAVWRIGAQWLVVKRQRQAAPAATALAAPIPVMLLKGKLRQWLGERYKNLVTTDAAFSIYLTLSNWLKGSWLADLEAFTATLPAGWTQDALDQAIQELHAHFAPDEDDAQAEPVISLDELEVVSSATGPTGWTDPEPEHELDSYNDESPTVAARRMNKLHTLKVHFTKTIDLLEDFGELTGRHIATLAVGRELANLIDILEAEMDGLQKGINNHA